MAALYTEDAVYEDLVLLPQPLVGRAAIEAFFDETFRRIPDAALALRSAGLAGELAVAEWVFSGSDQGIVPGAPPTGKPFSVRGATVFELEGDLIRRSSHYWDVSTVLMQLGLIPAPATPES
jgi:steroid delta-isomerase-like uncharacterized protein